MTIALKMFFGRQSLASSSASGTSNSIKVELSYIAEEYCVPESNEESAFLTKGYSPNNYFRGGGYNRRGQSYGNRTYQDPDSIFSSRRERDYLQDRSDGNQKEVKLRQLNPIGQDGNPIRCKCCKSIHPSFGKTKSGKGHKFCKDHFCLRHRNANFLQ